MEHMHGMLHMPFRFPKLTNSQCHLNRNCWYPHLLVIKALIEKPIMAPLFFHVVGFDCYAYSDKEFNSAYSFEDIAEHFVSLSLCQCNSTECGTRRDGCELRVASTSERWDKAIVLS